MNEENEELRGERRKEEMRSDENQSLGEWLSGAIGAGLVSGSGSLVRERRRVDSAWCCL